MKKKIEGAFWLKKVKIDGKLTVSDFKGLCLIKKYLEGFSNTSISAGS